MKYKGLIEIYESTNESNLIPYITPEKDVEGMRLLRETVKSIDPAAKIAGPASCHTDLPWTESVLAKGGAKYLDIITEHPYRNSPEYPDLALEMQNWRKVIDRSEARKILFILPENSTNIYLSSRNLPEVTVKSVDEINTYLIMNAYSMVMVDGVQDILASRIKR